MRIVRAMRRGPALFLAFAMLTVASSGAASAAEAPAGKEKAHKHDHPRDPKAMEILRNACELMKKSEAFRAKCYVTRIEGDPVLGRRLDVRATLTYRAPQEFQVVSEPPQWFFEGKPSTPEKPLAVSDIYANPFETRYVMPSLNEYLVDGTPNRVSSVYEEATYPTGTNFAGIAVFPVFMTEDPFDVMTRGHWGIEYAGMEKIDGVETHVLRQKPDGVVDLKMWIGADKPLFLQLATDTTRADAEKIQVLTPLFTVRFSDWDLQPKLTAEMFKFSPPPNMKKVESFSDPLPPPQTVGPATAPASAPAK